MGHVHPPRALLYRLPNVSTHWGAIRARLGPERWLEAAAHVVHRACSAERAELVAAPRRVRVCVCMCVHLVPLCVVVLAAPGACMSLRVRYDRTSRFDSLHMCGVHRRSSRRYYVVLRVSTIVSLVSRALVARAGGPYLTSISEFLNRTRTARQPRTPTRRPPGGARARAPGRAVARSHTHHRPCAHRTMQSPTRRDIEHTKAQPKRHSHSYTTRTVRSAGRRARARAFSISGETRREAGGDRRLGACCRASDQRVEKM